MPIAEHAGPNGERARLGWSAALFSMTQAQGDLAVEEEEPKSE